MRSALKSRAFAFAAVLVLAGGIAATLPATTLATVPTTWTVCASGCNYTTIQAAVNDPATLSGDSIQVSAGNYAVSGANINKSLTLLGAQAGVDARDGRPGAPESVITSGGLGTFALNATNVTFDGFKFTNLVDRTIDTYFDADHFTMKNTILAGNIDTSYTTGGIQFGGGSGLHANYFDFENNLVTADNGNLLYLGHAMDNGTVKNNLFHGDTVAFGPFGDRTGWLIEGNEFNGNVSGHGAYWGFAFNANLGDVTIRNNYVHQMSLGIGQISVVGGEISGNTFDDNQFGAFQLWGGEFGSIVSANVSIHNNLIEYNGAACSGFATASHGIRIRPGGDASTIHMDRNAFIDLGVGTCGEAWAIRQNDTGTADAQTNWWGVAGPATSISPKFSQGDVDFTPWIASYTDDPAHTGDLGFWPKESSIVLSKSDQTITWTSADPIPDATYPADVDVSATASSGLTVSFGASGDCTMADADTVHVTGAGACTVTASQLGDTEWNAAPDVNRSFNISKGTQTITFDSLPVRTYGDPDFDLTATATSGLTVSFSASGTCTMADADTVHLTGASGQATSTAISTLSVGNHSIRVIYQGNSTLTSALSPVMTQMVNKATPSVDLTLNSSPSTYGDAVTFTATVTSLVETPGGSVQFRINGANFGSPVVLDPSGQATSAAISTLSPGNYSIRAIYTGCSNFAGVTSAVKTQKVKKATPTVGISSSANPSTHGDAVTFTATVSGTATTPSGFVQFRIDGVDVGSPVALVSGQATSAPVTLAAGSHRIRVFYLGSSRYLTAWSPLLTQVVNH